MTRPPRSVCASAPIKLLPLPLPLSPRWENQAANLALTAAESNPGMQENSGISFINIQRASALSVAIFRGAIL